MSIPAVVSWLAVTQFIVSVHATPPSPLLHCAELTVSEALHLLLGRLQFLPGLDAQSLYFVYKPGVSQSTLPLIILSWSVVQYWFIPTPTAMPILKT
jgi:hypothetical protein